MGWRKANFLIRDERNSRMGSVKALKEKASKEGESPASLTGWSTGDYTEPYGSV
jgi:hypothetical protein